MKVKTSELTGAALDWAVARCERHWTFEPDGLDSYSSDWALAGPIIEREYIELTIDLAWNAAIRGGDKDDIAHGPTPLVAAMRCYVMSELGDEIDVPGELLGDDEPPEPEHPEPTGKLLRDYTTDDFNPKMKHWSDK